MRRTLSRRTAAVAPSRAVRAAGPGAASEAVLCRDPGCGPASPPRRPVPGGRCAAW